MKDAWETRPGVWDDAFSRAANSAVVSTGGPPSATCTSLVGPGIIRLHEGAANAKAMRNGTVIRIRSIEFIVPI
jgi:hypothetical protein